MSIELLDSIYNELYEYAVLPQYRDLIKKAEKTFILNDDKTDTDGFAEWFIFNYRPEAGSKRLIDNYQLSQENSTDLMIKEALAAIKKSKRSLYEVRSEHDQAVLKDIFNNEDFVIENTIVEIDQLISGRIVVFEGKNYLVGDIFEIELHYKESIVKYILDQYNQYTITYGMISLDGFLDINGHLIYKVMVILNSIDDENSFENELMLHQATYAFRCTSESLYEKFMTLHLPVFADEDDEPILRVMSEDTIVAEIEITNGQFYVLCNNEAHLNQMLEIMKPILSNEIVFMKTETYSLEDLL